MSAVEKITKSYLEYVLEEGKKPVSVAAFTKKLKLKESDFYQEFTSFSMVEAAVWNTFFEDTITRMESEEVFMSYSAREKTLSFYYTWIEVLKENRSYVLIFFEKNRAKSLKELDGMTAFKEGFKDYADKILIEGIENREVQQRPFISDKYASLLFGQALMVTNFWVKDETKAFEKTDVFIEKSVNTVFDLMGKSALDSVFDLVKFMLQK